jgi:lipoprotein-releasing system permease protein
MYVYLLWVRYLKTRRLAFICMASVMLGVATLIVVNSVMSGFSSKLMQKLHDKQSDIVIESTDPMTGFPITADEMMARIRNSPANAHIAAMAPSVDLMAIVQYRWRGRMWAFPVHVVGIDPKYQKDFPGFAEYLLQEDRKRSPSFDIDAEATRRYEFFHPPLPPDALLQIPAPPAPAGDDVVQLPPIDSKPGKKVEFPAAPLDPPPLVQRQLHGIIVGHALASFRNGNDDEYILERGDPITVFTIGGSLEPVWDEFVVCDYFKSEMSDYDSQTVYVPLDHLQHLRTMEGRVNTLQIRVKDEAQLQALKQVLQTIFPIRDGYIVNTWKDKQGALLAAISVERGILNLLLFMIIGVAGFGILAIFSMIVTEKTRDIGILKSLGASSRGVMSIFLGYGLLLGLIGSALGTALGLYITYHINGIERWIGKYTGQELFDRKIYYFNEIPVDVQWGHVLSVVAGAVLIAVVFSILPALKASWLRPVQALRYE